MSELTIINEKDVDSKIAVDSLTNALQKRVEWFDSENKDDFSELNILRMYRSNEQYVIRCANTLVTDDLKVIGVKYYDIPEIPGKTGVFDSNVIIWNFFHDKGVVLMAEAIKQALITHTGVLESRLRVIADHDLELDTKKIAGVSWAMSEKIYTFEIGLITLEKDIPYHQSVLPDAEYDRTIYLKDEPHLDRLGSTGLVNEFPALDKEAFIKTVLEYLTEAIRSLPKGTQDQSERDLSELYPDPVISSK